MLEKTQIEESGKDQVKDKCFVIMPISDQEGYSPEHFQKVYEQIFIPAIRDAGYEPYRVDENKICDSIIDKIFLGIQDCPMALCDLSSRNPNVLYELGIRQAYDKPVVLVQDDKSARIFDVSGINTTGYKSTRLYEEVIQAREDITEAIKATKTNKSNTNSLVRIVKAKQAVIDKSDISKEEKIEYALMSMAKDISSLKKLIPENNMVRISSFDADGYFNEMQFIQTRIKDLEYLLRSGNNLTDEDKKDIIFELKALRSNYNNKMQYLSEGSKNNVEEFLHKWRPVMSNKE